MEVQRQHCLLQSSVGSPIGWQITGSPAWPPRPFIGAWNHDRKRTILYSESDHWVVWGVGSECVTGSTVVLFGQVSQVHSEGGQFGVSSPWNQERALLEAPGRIIESSWSLDCSKYLLMLYANLIFNQ